MSDAATPGFPVSPRPALWRKHRLPLLAAGAALWFGGIALMHQRAERIARGEFKGARELLQIGALPVT